MDRSLFIRPELRDDAGRLFRLLESRDLWIGTYDEPLKCNVTVQSSDTRKPKGAWFSRGDWLAHEHGGLRNYIHVVRLRPDCSVFVAKSASDLQKITSWPDLAAQYAGFAMPINLYDPATRVGYRVAGFDVASLVIWDFAAIEIIATYRPTDDDIGDCNISAVVDWVFNHVWRIQS